LVEDVLEDLEAMLSKEYLATARTMISRIAIAAVLAVFAVAHGIALQNKHAAGWSNPAAAAIEAVKGD
jgi:hypothetical protein